MDASNPGQDVSDPDPQEGPLWLALALMALAGCVDATGFLKLGHLFVSFMSGDSTQVAVSLAERRWGEASQPAAVIALFLLGAFSGPLVAAAAGDTRRRPVLLLLQAVFVSAASWVGGTEIDGPRIGAAVGLAAFAMGLQNTVMQRVGTVQVHPFVTSNIVGFAQGVAHVVLGKQSRGWVRHGLLWVSLVAGGAVGAKLYGRFGLRAWDVAALGYVLLSLREFTSRDRGPGA